ncbi:hypothetical protein N9Y60_05785 [Crocinitomicaceae bacterium]|nr:hypothetical protein [Crocinitomicaceae bacterium]
MNSQNTSKLSHPYFENLNGLRAIGALSVFVFHSFLLGNEIWGDFYQSKYFQIAVQVFSKGNYGVSLFFVLSGFLITYLLLHEAKSKGAIGVFGFFMRLIMQRAKGLKRIKHGENKAVLFSREGLCITTKGIDPNIRINYPSEDGKQLNA